MGLLKFSPAQEAISAWCSPQQHDVVKEPAASGVLPGLANLGNTCFANSVLQCLLNTPGWFPEACLAFGQFEGSPLSKRAGLGRSFQSLAREYGATAGGALERSNPALKNMKEAIAAVDPQYAGCQQQDAYEFLGCLLEALEGGFGALFQGAGDSAPGPAADVIRAICGVATHTRRECHSCGGRFEVDHVTDTALRLPLLSPDAQFDASLREREEQVPVTLYELLEAARRPETIEGYDCDACRERCKCSNTEHARSTITQHAGVISATRDVLIVVLYRFGHALDAQGNFRPTKVKRQVACPTELTLDTVKYSLFGVVSHLGQSLSAGHYVAAVRSRRDDLWYECNDEKVTLLNVAALYDGRAVTAVRPGAEPYILFYHRRPGTDVSEPPAAMTQDALAAEVSARIAGSDVPREPAVAGAAAAANAAGGAVAGIAAPEGDAQGAAASEGDDGAVQLGAEEGAADCSVVGDSREGYLAAPREGDAGATTAPQEGSDAMEVDEGEWVIVPESQTVDAELPADMAAVATGESATATRLVRGGSGDDSEGEGRSVRRRLEGPAKQVTWAPAPAPPPPLPLPDKSSGGAEGGGMMGALLPRVGSCPLFAGAVRRGRRMLTSVGAAATEATDWVPGAETCTAACSAEGVEFFAGSFQGP